MAMTIGQRIDRAWRWLNSPVGSRAYYPPYNDPVDNFLNMVTMNGVTYPLRTTLSNEIEPIGADFTGLVQGAYKANGIVFAACLARMMLLSQARFQWQQMRSGQPGDLFGNQDLDLLEHPEPGKVTADLLARASVDVDIAGNSFIAKRVLPGGGARLKRMLPHWTDIIIGSPNPAMDVTRHDIDAEVIGYVYYPGGRFSGEEPEIMLREDVAHLAPVPDPLHRHRGMSWLTPIIGEIQSDQAALTHKLAFFRNGATVNLVVSTGITDPAKFAEFLDRMDEAHKGAARAYKTLYLQEGGDAKAIGANMEQMQFTEMSAKAETRIAMAAGVHPVILGTSEGLGGSSLNQGNFMAARRLVADMTLRPWWGTFAASMEVLIPPPTGARLFYDDRHIPFLAEDVKEAAEVQSLNAQAIKALGDAGYKPDAVVEAVMANDLRRLRGQHSGLFSVQLQPPQPDGPAKPDPLVIPPAA